MNAGGGGTVNATPRNYENNNSSSGAGGLGSGADEREGSSNKNDNGGDGNSKSGNKEKTNSDKKYELSPSVAPADKQKDSKDRPISPPRAVLRSRSPLCSKK